MTQLSDHFTLEEAVNSQTASRLGIDNSSPSDGVIAAATKTAVKMEKVRLILGTPINVDSWIRCIELNRALGSKDTSQHIKGEAVDFIAPEFGTPLDICNKLIANKELVGWDQLILEHTWVHISWNSIPDSTQRGEVISLLATGGYALGLTDPQGNKLA